MATREEIDQVRAAVNIVDVVSPYVALKRSGPVWKGLCPFHAEKSPSFQVNPDKGFWYCFGGCSTGGDAFKFLERVENLSFGESLERLAQMAGITLTRSSRDPAPAAGHRDRLYNALELSAAYYQEMLAQSEHARRYLLDRGIAPDTIASFRLGYAGESFDGLANYLRRNKVEADDAFEAGVLTPSDRGQTPYDKMRTRIICPILDVHDRPIAFGGRLMEDVKDRPKYLNTAETPLFSKGKTFFAMSRARKSMGDSGYAVVVEGYFDVISAHQSGFNNVVATLGTASTPEHADLLRRQVQRVILAFDADPAGFKAAQRASGIFEAKEMETLVLDMPRGEDPDSLLRAGRTADFQKAIDNAVPIREFQLRTVLEHYLSRQNLTEAQKSTVFRREIVPLLRATGSVLERERYIRMAAPLHPYFEQGSAYAEDQIRQEIGGNAASAPQQSATGYNGASRGENSGSSSENERKGRSWQDGKSFGRRNTGNPRMHSASPQTAPKSGVQAAEEILLRALAGRNATLGTIVRQRENAADLLTNLPARELAQRMLLQNTSSGVAGELMEIVTRAEATEGVESDMEQEMSRIAARLLAAGDSSEQEEAGDNGAGNRSQPGAAAPINAGIVSDAIALLARHREMEQEKLLRYRVDQGDVAAAQDLMKLVRNLHGGGARTDTTGSAETTSYTAA